MLTPVRMATDGALQPFRFVALGDDDHRALRMVVDSAADRSFPGNQVQPVDGAEISLSGKSLAQRLMMFGGWWHDFYLCNGFGKGTISVVR